MVKVPLKKFDDKCTYEEGCFCNDCLSNLAELQFEKANEEALERYLSSIE